MFTVSYSPWINNPRIVRQVIQHQQLDVAEFVFHHGLLEPREHPLGRPLGGERVDPFLGLSPNTPPGSLFTENDVVIVVDGLGVR